MSAAPQKPGEVSEPPPLIHVSVGYTVLLLSPSILIEPPSVVALRVGLHGHKMSCVVCIDRLRELCCSVMDGNGKGSGDTTSCALQLLLWRSLNSLHHTQASREWHMVEEEKRLLEKVRGMYGSTGRSPRGVISFLLFGSSSSYFTPAVIEW